MGRVIFAIALASMFACGGHVVSGAPVDAAVDEAEAGPTADTSPTSLDDGPDSVDTFFAVDGLPDPAGWERVDPDAPGGSRPSLFGSIVGRADDDVWVGDTNGEVEYYARQSLWSWDGHRFAEMGAAGGGLGYPGLCATRAAYWSLDYFQHFLTRGTSSGVVIVDSAPGTAPNAITCTSSAVWSLGGDGHIRRHVEGVDGWSLVDDGLAALAGGWSALDAVADDDVWLVSDAGAIARWNGAGWTGVTAPTLPNPMWISGSSSSDVWLTTRDAVALHWDGSAFHEVSLPRGATAVFAVSSKEAWAVGRGDLQRWDGMRWADQALPRELHADSPGRDYLQAVWASPSYVWVVAHHVWRKPR